MVGTSRVAYLGVEPGGRSKGRVPSAKKLMMAELLGKMYAAPFRITDAPPCLVPGIWKSSAAWVGDGFAACAGFAGFADFAGGAGGAGPGGGGAMLMVTGGVILMATGGASSALTGSCPAFLGSAKKTRPGGIAPLGGSPLSVK